MSPLGSPLLVSILAGSHELFCWYASYTLVTFSLASSNVVSIESLAFFVIRMIVSLTSLSALIKSLIIVCSRFIYVMERLIPTAHFDSISLLKVTT